MKRYKIHPKTLFLIDGIGGTGKSDMVSYIKSKHEVDKDIFIITKKTTRLQRKIEKKIGYHLELDFVSQPTFKEYLKDRDFYNYEFSGVHYGFHKKELQDALSAYNNIFIIVRNKRLIERISLDFPKINVVVVYIYSDRENIVKRLKEEGYKDDEIKFRLSRLSASWDDYLLQSNMYREIIINNSSILDFHRMIDFLIDKYNLFPKNKLIISRTQEYPLLKSLEGHKHELLDRIERYPFEKNVFLMMKFRLSNNKVYLFIKRCLEENGFNCVRADEKDWDITHDVYNPLAVLYCCKYGIVLFDEPEENNFFSPNVAYELGIMHYQNKECLILRNAKLPTMPFDLIKDLHSKYTDNLEIEDIIKDWVYKIKLGNSQF
jgi:guanylate kinase